MRLADGVEVRIRGRVDFYPPQGRLQLIMNGEQVSPGFKDEIVWGEFAIGSVYEDVVNYSGPGLNRNRINFYTYRVRALDSLLGRDRTDPRFASDESRTAHEPLLRAAIELWPGRHTVAECVDALGNARWLVLDQVDQDVRIQHVDHKPSRSCTGRAAA